MKNPRTPTTLTGPRQLNLMFDTMRMAGLGAAERRTVALTLAQILMQAAGLAIEELDDDDR